MPVARSRSRTRWTPMRSIASAPMTPPPRNPVSGLRPRSSAPEPPEVATSASECPAKDWPRSTVKTPTPAETMATIAPMSAAVCTGPLEKSPGSKSQPTRSALLERGVHGDRRAELVLVARAGDHDQPVVHAQHLGAYDLFDRAAGGAPARQVDDAVHDRDERVHLVRRQQDGHAVLLGQR